MAQNRWLLGCGLLIAGTVAMIALAFVVVNMALNGDRPSLAGLPGWGGGAVATLMIGIAGTFIAFATEGLMTHNSPPAMRGRSGGWFQSGNQFAQTAGGGLGMFLMKHPKHGRGALQLVRCWKN